MLANLWPKSSHVNSKSTRKRVYGPAVILALFFWLATLFPGLVQASPLLANSVPVLQARAGFDSYYKLNSWLPLQVNLSLPNGLANFDGWVEASFTNFSADTTVYRRAVQLVAPASRQVWLYLPTGNRNLLAVQVRLVNRDNSLVATQEVPVQPTDQSELLVGVISDNPTALANISGFRPSLAYNKGSIFYATNYYSRTPPPGIIPSLRFVHITPQDLPPEATGWDSLDGLVLTDLSNTNLANQFQNEASYQGAAAGWLAQGRFLFTAGDGSLTHAGFLSDFSPVRQTGGPQTGPLPDQLKPFLTDPTPAPLLSAVTALLPGASAQVIQNGVPYLAEKPFGLGRTWFNAANFSVLPNSILAAVWKIAFQDYEPHISYTTGLRLPSDLIPPWTSQLSPNTRQATLPDWIYIAFILAAYILVLGPASYIILKRLGKLEWGWYVAPVLALVATVGFYVAGAVTGGEPLVVSRLSIVVLGATGQGHLVGGTTNLATLYSNDRQSLDLQVSDRTQAIGLNSESSGLNQSFIPTLADFSRIQQGSGGGFGPVFLGQSDTRSFALEGVVPPKVGEGIALDLTAQGAQGSELSGTIENRSQTDWTNLSIWSSGNIIYQIPRLKAGEKITLTKDYALLNSTDSLVLVLAGLVNGKAGTSNSALSFGIPGFFTQEVTILSTLMGTEGQALPKGANRVYLIGWSDSTFDFPLQIGNQKADGKDLTLLFEPLTLS